MAAGVNAAADNSTGTTQQQDSGTVREQGHGLDINRSEDATLVTAAAAKAAPSVVTLSVTDGQSAGSGSGVVLDDLRAAAGVHGLTFGPDPSTWARNAHNPNRKVAPVDPDAPPPGSIAHAYRRKFGQDVVKRSRYFERMLRGQGFSSSHMDPILLDTLGNATTYTSAPIKVDLTAPSAPSDGRAASSAASVASTGLIRPVR